MAHDNAVRARVIAAVLQGMSYRRAADAFGVSKDTARSWHEEWVARNGEFSASKVADLLSRDDKSALAHTAIEGLKSVHLLLSDKGYLASQRASDLAELYARVGECLSAILAAE